MSIISITMKHVSPLEPSSCQSLRTCTIEGWSDVHICRIALISPLMSSWVTPGWGRIILQAYSLYQLRYLWGRYGRPRICDQHFKHFDAHFPNLSKGTLWANTRGERVAAWTCRKCWINHFGVLKHKIVIYRDFIVPCRTPETFVQIKTHTLTFSPKFNFFVLYQLTI